MRESLQVHTPADARRLHWASRERTVDHGSALRQAQGERSVVVPPNVKPPDLWLHGQVVGSVNGVVEV
ncbi:MAG: hypothetical protein OEZ39_02405 [Gammaproteobacteria bacterium]|nr:hypothetical protein [Gammaproteobacteria bacterium]